MARLTQAQLLARFPDRSLISDEFVKKTEGVARVAAEQAKITGPNTAKGEVLSGIDTSAANAQVAALQDAATAFKDFQVDQGNFLNTLFGTVDYSKKAREFSGQLGSFTGAVGVNINQGFEGVSKQLSDDRNSFQQQILDEAKQKTAKLQAETFDTFQKGLFGGKTIQEIINEEQQQRLGAVTEADRQQRNFLIRQQALAQQQLEMEGKQGALRTNTVLGGRGLGNSSIGQQMLAEQQSETANKEAQGVANLSEGLTSISQSTNKQKAQIENEELKRQGQLRQDTQASFDTQKAQRSQQILQDQTEAMQRLTAEYSMKRNEIDRLVDQTNQILSDVLANAANKY